MTLADVIDKYGITSPNVGGGQVKESRRCCRKIRIWYWVRKMPIIKNWILVPGGCIHNLEHAYSKDGGIEQY